MTHDITLFDEAYELDNDAAPPLCLVHYFGATGQGPPAPPSRGRIAVREGNLLILEFASPPKTKSVKHASKRRLMEISDALVLLLLLASIAGCIAAFRF